MDSVILIAPNGISLAQLLACIPTDYQVEASGEGCLVVKDKQRRVYLRADASIRSELEPSELQLILTAIPNPSFYVLDFSDIDVCKELLTVIADRPDLMVDNDHGIICSGAEFVRILERRPAWDWRRDAV